MTKPRYRFLISLTVICCFLAPAYGQGQSDRANLEGSWTLIKYKYGGDVEFSDVPGLVTYVKHLTKNHFSWASYGERGELLTAGGGKYTFKDGKYREEIDYFHPLGSNLAGTHIDFEYSVNGNNWHISGYGKNVQLNPGSGEFEEVDSVRLEEIWQRL